MTGCDGTHDIHAPIRISRSWAPALAHGLGPGGLGRGLLAQRSYQFFLRIAEVTTTTPATIPAARQFSSTTYIGSSTSDVCQIVPTTTLNMSRPKLRFSWKAGSMARTFLRIGPQKPHGRTLR